MSVDRYSCQQITPEDEQAVLAALRSPWLTQGPLVEQFERALAEYVGAKHAVAVSSGTAALYVAYRAAKAKRIVTSPLSFVATANAAILAGASVGFVDVSRSGGLIGPRGAFPEREDRDRPPFFVPVHYAGRVRPPDVYADLADVTIEDAAHALGASHADSEVHDNQPRGRLKVGSCKQSLACCFSFHPVKAIAAGEGGAVTTNSEELADEMRLLRSHGRDARGLTVKPSHNFRMDEMSAALALSQLKRLDRTISKRQAVALRYAAALSDVTEIVTPLVRLDDGNAWHLFPIRVKDGRRDAVAEKMRALGVGVQIHYLPIHEQPFYAKKYKLKPEDFPEAHAWGAEELSIPLHPQMTEEDVAAVVASLKVALGHDSVGLKCKLRLDAEGVTLGGEEIAGIGDAPAGPPEPRESGMRSQGSDYTEAQLAPLRKMRMTEADVAKVCDDIALQEHTLPENEALIRAKLEALR